MWQIRTGISKNPRVINGYATPVELGKTFVPLFSWTPTLVRSQKDPRVLRVKTASPRRSCGGRYWDRTSDLFRVKEARYHYANRP